MENPTEHKDVPARILAYAEAVGWTFLSRKEAEERRQIDSETPHEDRAQAHDLISQ